MANNPNHLKNLKPFTSTNQPANRGRKGKTVSEWIKEIGDAKKIEYRIEITNGKDEVKTKQGKITSKTTINQLIAINMVTKAVNGDLKAIEMVLDRSEGKAQQNMKLSNDPDNPIDVNQVTVFSLPDNKRD